jgi:phosphoribosyl 1,2-cyclic phosphodiesterase
MQLTFLGTSAANAYPEPFCRCENCRKARALGGRSLRKRSAALVNDDLLIDLGPDIMAASQTHRVPLTNVRYCLQTHPHADHMDLSHLLSRSPGFGVVGAPRLHFYASSVTLQRADQTFKRDLAQFGLFDPRAEEELNVTIHPIEPLQPFAVGPYRVVAFPANHTPRPGALLYAVAAQARTLFYGLDTAALLEETWRAFHQLDMRFDLVVFDHTYGPDEPGSDHLSAHQVIEHTRRLRAEGLLKEKGRVFASHIAHEGNPVHPELVAFASQHGYEVAYDGLQWLRDA